MGVNVAVRYWFATDKFNSAYFTAWPCLSIIFCWSFMGWLCWFRFMKLYWKYMTIIQYYGKFSHAGSFIRKVQRHFDLKIMLLKLMKKYKD